MAATIPAIRTCRPAWAWSAGVGMQPSRSASARRTCRDGRRGGALQFLPRRISLASLREASAGCEGCPLYKDATETVFGRGSSSARAVFVGEQPGNEEDLRGEPFVGPAGRLLDRALERAGIAREDVYLTNVVKHFKWTPKGKLRLHRKPGAREIAACLPWLEKELELIRPHVLVCLGATAAQALLGRDFRVSTQRGRLFPSRFAPRVLATVHPSSILRGDPAERERELERFGADLVTVAGLLDGR